eukprot:scaffold10515_cov24-Prasinocladus_malaysianus.AAC.2
MAICIAAFKQWREKRAIHVSGSYYYGLVMLLLASYQIGQYISNGREESKKKTRTADCNARTIMLLPLQLNLFVLLRG